MITSIPNIIIVTFFCDTQGTHGFKLHKRNKISHALVIDGYCMCGTIPISCKTDDPCAVRLCCYFHCIKQMPICVWKCISVDWISKTLDIAYGLQCAKVFSSTSFSPYSPNFLPLYFESFHMGFSTGYIQCTFVMFLWNSKHLWLERNNSLKLLLRVIYKVTLSFYHLIIIIDIFIKYFMCMDFCILHINENHWIYTHIIL